MKFLSLERFSPLEILEQLQYQIGGEIFINDRESVLKIHNDIAKGSISQYVLKNGISYLNYTITFENDTSLKLNCEKSSVYDFVYSLGSNPGHNFGEDGEERKIEKFRTAIFYCKMATESVLQFTSGKLYEICIISLSTIDPSHAVNLNEALIKDLQNIFGYSQTGGSNAYIGSLNLKIADRIHQLNETSQNGLVRALLIEATVSTIMALQIQQHFEDLASLKSKFGSLTQSEVSAIQRLSNIINSSPELEYTIDALCQQSGLTKAKLQEGFKLMHGKTVSNYVRNVRILAAEHLIKTTDMNISEVVYSIGLTSRSYFSKIFKKKYMCSPKSYQENRGMVFMSA